MHGAPDWITTPHIPADHRGPTDRPFTPFGDPAGATPMIERLASVAARSPRHLAVVDDEGSLTYSQFLRSIYRLAQAIERLRAPSGPVAILLPTGRAYAVAVYACLAARRVAVLLDAGYPRARNDAIVSATGVTVMLTDDADLNARSDLAVLGVDLVPDNDAAFDPVAKAAVSDMLDVDAPAFIICTSGSTGHPKAIVHSQRTMLHFARAAHDAFHVDANDRVMAMSSLASLGGIAPLLHLPLVGATLHLINIKERGISGMLSDLNNCPISILGAAPSLLRGIARLPEATQAFARLRIVQTYGESLMKDDVRILRTVIPRACYIRTAYGATEAGGLSWFADECDTHDPLRVAAGILMPDTAAAIVDESGAHCARGEVGELLLRGRYTALGELVDGRIVAGRLELDPEDRTRRIYRTGDLARCDHEGVFVLLGRADRMTNINGQRVEPAEVESALRRHPDVDKAEVLVHTRNNAASLLAFVVAMPGRAAGLESSLRQQLRGSLPSFMVPARIVLVDSMPLLPGGKVDAQALRALAGGVE
jgi:acyl-coenzyme A synthetase/AMP-(fatty) acid ligase